MCCLVRATDENGTEMKCWLARWKPQKFTENCSSELHRKWNPWLNSQTPVLNCFNCGTAHRQKTDSHNTQGKSLIYYALHHIYLNIRWGLFPNTSLVKLQGRNGQHVIITHKIKHVHTSSRKWCWWDHPQVNMIPAEVCFRHLALCHLERK